MHAYKPEKPKRRVDSCNNDIPHEQVSNGHVRSDNHLNGHTPAVNGLVQKNCPNSLAKADNPMNGHTNTNNSLNGIVRHPNIVSENVKTESNGLSKTSLDDTYERNGHLPLKEKLQ